MPWLWVSSRMPEGMNENGSLDSEWTLRAERAHLLGLYGLPVLSPESPHHWSGQMRGSRA